MHHNDSPNLDPRTDITDLFAFQKPGDPAKSVLIFNVYPEAPSRAAAFDPLASYELKIDTNGDFDPDIAFHILFSSPDGGHQIASVYRAPPRRTPGVIALPGVRCFSPGGAGLRQPGFRRLLGIIGWRLSGTRSYPVDFPRSIHVKRASNINKVITVRGMTNSSMIALKAGSASC